MDYTTKTMQYANGVNCVHSPVLSDEEQAGRKLQLKKAAQRFLKSVERERSAGKQERLEA